MIVFEFYLFINRYKPAQSAEAVEYTNSIYAKSNTPGHSNKWPEYDTKLHLIVRLKSWTFGECGVLFHYHYSEVHFDLEW